MAGTIERIRVDVTSTHDDKDREIAFQLKIRDERNDRIIGDSGDVGLGEIWNESTNPVDFAVQTFPYAERLYLWVDHFYHNPSKGNQGWEGKITVNAQVDGGFGQKS